jgi:hypothetical protein
MTDAYRPAHSQRMNNKSLSEGQNQRPSCAALPAEATSSNSIGIAAAPLPDEGTGRAYFGRVNLGPLQRHKVEHWLAELITERNVSRVQGFRHHR